MSEDDSFISREDVPGSTQPDGSLLFAMSVPPTASTVEIAGVVWDIPPGATRIHVTVSTSDDGQTTLGLRPVYEGDTTT